MVHRKSFQLLAIDYDVQNLKLIKEALTDTEVEVVVANDSAVGLEIFRQSHPRVVLLDLTMPKVGGISLLNEILAIDPGSDVILMSGASSTESAVKAILAGASDYLDKPLNISKLKARIAQLLSDAEKRKRTGELEHHLLDACQFEGIIGRSPLMLELFAKIRRVSPHFRNVLVTGATGTGKELVARALHRLSPSASGPFVVCNCSAIVETLV
jgi:DNA-binding NtrC family response regulator